MGQTAVKAASQKTGESVTMFNWMKTAILMAGITGLFGIIGAVMGGQLGMPRWRPRQKL